MTTDTGTFEGLDATDRADISRRAQQLRQGLEMAFRASGAELGLDALLERLQVIRTDTERLEQLVASHADRRTTAASVSAPASG